MSGVRVPPPALRSRCKSGVSVHRGSGLEGQFGLQLVSRSVPGDARCRSSRRWLGLPSTPLLPEAALEGSDGTRRAPARLSRRRLVREVPPARRAAGQTPHRAGVDGARAARLPATSPSARPSSGSPTCLTRPAAASCPGWSGPAPRSPTRSPSSCAGIEHDREPQAVDDRATTNRSSARTCCPPSAGGALEDITTEQVERWSAELAARGHDQPRPD